MKLRLYRYVSLLLTAAVLLSLGGCVHRSETPVYDDEDCFERFMDAVCGGDYQGAFALVASDVKTAPGAAVQTGEQTQQADTVSRDEFVAKYTDIFGALGVSSVTYEKKDESVGGSRKTVAYTAKYVTDMAGTLTNDFTMSLKLEGTAWRVAWTPALIFPEMTWGSTVRITNTYARRGDIISDGQIIALTRDLDAVYADLTLIEDNTEFAQKVCPILDLNVSDTVKKLDNSRSSTVVLGQYVGDKLTPDMREELTRIEGVGIINNYGTDRIYPYGSMLAHTLGYVGYPTEDEVESLNAGRDPKDGLYTADSMVGKSGLEQVYEKQLRGNDGYNVTIRNADGSLAKLVYRKPVEDGVDVVLTVDIAMQQRTEELLDLVLWGDDTAGAVVVMDPTSGAVKAIASYPTYDLNTLTQDYSELIAQPNAPLFNRTTQGLYPPGSAFKVFTATAAMETGTVNESYVFTGTIEDDYWIPTGYGNWHWPAIKRAEVINRSTPLNMENGLLHSDNIYFADLALKMGEQKFFNYLRSVGMEQKMPFELNVATSTIKKVGDNASDTEWNLRSIAETGYGQGQVTMTPLQLAAMYCAFRNNGSIPSPYITDSFYKTEGTDYHAVETFGETTWIMDAIKPYSISVLTPMMEHIVDPSYNGTGRTLRARGCTVAGKTGTAEKTDDKTREVSWFVGFRIGVAKEDELLVLVVLEVPTKDEYAYLKFDIARELISLDAPSGGGN